MKKIHLDFVYFKVTKSLKMAHKAFLDFKESYNKINRETISNIKFQKTLWSQIIK